MGVMSLLQIEAVKRLAFVARFLASCGEVSAMSARSSRASRDIHGASDESIEEMQRDESR